MRVSIIRTTMVCYFDDYFCEGSPGKGVSDMGSREDNYTPARSSGCFWIVTKLVLVLLVFMIFFLGLFAGVFVSAVASTLM